MQQRVVQIARGTWTVSDNYGNPRLNINNRACAPVWEYWCVIHSQILWRSERCDNDDQYLHKHFRLGEFICSHNKINSLFVYFKQLSTHRILNWRETEIKKRPAKGAVWRLPPKYLNCCVNLHLDCFIVVMFSFCNFFKRPNLKMKGIILKICILKLKQDFLSYANHPSEYSDCCVNLHVDCLIFIISFFF